MSKDDDSSDDRKFYMQKNDKRIFAAVNWRDQLVLLHLMAVSLNSYDYNISYESTIDVSLG